MPSENVEGLHKQHIVVISSVKQAKVVFAQSCVNWNSNSLRQQHSGQDTQQQQQNSANLFFTTTTFGTVGDEKFADVLGGGVV